MLISPSIPYCLYIHEDYLLLVPREVNEYLKHPKFPTNPNQKKRYTLRISDRWFRIYTEIYGKPPKFTHKHVAFGLQDEMGVIITAELPGRRIIPCWTFDSILASTETEIKEHITIDFPWPLDNFFDSLKLDSSRNA